MYIPKYAWWLHRGIMLILLIIISFAITKSQPIKDPYTIYLERENAQLKQTVVNLQYANEQLQREMNEYKIRNNELYTQVNRLQQSNSATSRGINTTARYDIGTRSIQNSTTYQAPCRLQQGNLISGGVYTTDLTEVMAQGWVIQLYSSRDLCNALSEAQKLSASFGYQYVYLHSKRVNGVDYYAVIYGMYPSKSNAQIALTDLSNRYSDIKRRKAYVTFL